MNSEKIWDNLWKYIFPILSVVLWILTIVLLIKSRSGYDTRDFEAQIKIINATRWHPACCIGAIISTAAAYVVSELRRHFERDKQS